MSNQPRSASLPPEDTSIVAQWLDADPTRWIAGILSGLFAGAIALALAMVLSVLGGNEPAFPAKLMATIVLGPWATEYTAGMSTILVGVAVFEAICAFFGFVFGHFVKTNQLPALLGMGLTWGAFSWIFIWNLFMHSIKPILYAGVSEAATFPVCMAYGISLTSVAFFHRMLGGTSKY